MVVTLGVLVFVCWDPVLEPVALLLLVALLFLPGAQASVCAAFQLGQLKVPETGSASAVLLVLNKKTKSKIY